MSNSTAKKFGALALRALRLLTPAELNKLINSITALSKVPLTQLLTKDLGIKSKEDVPTDAPVERKLSLVPELPPVTAPRPMENVVAPKAERKTRVSAKAKGQTEVKEKKGRVRRGEEVPEEVPGSMTEFILEQKKLLESGRAKLQKVQIIESYSQAKSQGNENASAKNGKEDFQNGLLINKKQS